MVLEQGRGNLLEVESCSGHSLDENLGRAYFLTRCGTED